MDVDEAGKDEAAAGLDEVGAREQAHLAAVLVRAADEDDRAAAGGKAAAAHHAGVRLGPAGARCCAAAGHQLRGVQYREVGLDQLLVPSLLSPASLRRMKRTRSVTSPCSRGISMIRRC